MNWNMYKKPYYQKVDELKSIMPELDYKLINARGHYYANKKDVWHSLSEKI